MMMKKRKPQHKKLSLRILLKMKMYNQLKIVVMLINDSLLNST